MKITIQDLLDCTEWKVCSVCKDEKKVLFFSKRGANGRKSWCKQCDANKYKAKKHKLIESFEKPSLYQRTLAWLFK